MSALDFIKTAISNPAMARGMWDMKFHRAEMWPRYSRLCAERGLARSVFILSFDCDTERDFEVGWDVYSRLVDIGITPVYFVPGDLLRRGEAVYRRVAEHGAVFLNHGGCEHTVYDKATQSYRCTFFYHDETPDSIARDMVLGHETLKDVLGVTAKGWRTPHFGSFQTRREMDVLYGVLSRLGYEYSTSTVPAVSYIKGPAYKDHGIWEIPVTGWFTVPLNILDSWGFYAAPGRSAGPEDFSRECDMLTRFAAEHPVMINIYADPSQVADRPEFFAAMKRFSEVAQNMTYETLLKQVKA